MARSASSLFSRSMMHTAATLHYVEGLSQVEVARRMEVSTASVSRLLARAREEGVVRIEVVGPDEASELGGELRAALGLAAARVVEGRDRGAPAVLAAQVAALVREGVPAEGAIVAIGWGRTVQGVIGAGLPQIPGATVVPTSGGMNETAAHFQINEFVRVAAEQMGGEARLLHAPSLPSRELREMFSRDRETARMLALWSRIDVAVVGIGDFGTATTNRDAVLAGGGAEFIAGDVVRHYFDEDGALIDWPGHDDLLAVAPDQLRRIPRAIGVAAGREKVRAIIGAARSRMINAVVTDSRTARLVLERLRGADGPDGRA